MKIKITKIKIHKIKNNLISNLLFLNYQMIPHPEVSLCLCNIYLFTYV